MINGSYTKEFSTSRPAADVYAAASNPRAWWNADITGDPGHLGGKFVHEVPNLHRAELQVSDADPGKRLAWRVLESDMKFLEENREEWVGTEIVFDIESHATGATVRFTHDGLIPSHDCFEICEDAWAGYIASLRTFIEAGVGRPNQERG
jgi:hypothetical protein